MFKFATFSMENGVPVLQNEIQVELKDVPSSDPLAFVAGVSEGQRYNKLGNAGKAVRIDHRANFSDLAKEYIRGFLFGYRNILVPEGTKIKKGQEQNFALFDLNIHKNS